MSKFEHAIDDSFVAKLRFEADKGEWWTDVLADRDLVVAIRGSYLNVYWRGQSIFLVEPSGSGLKVTTHEKFLIDPELASRVRPIDRKFHIAKLVKEDSLTNTTGRRLWGK